MLTRLLADYKSSFSEINDLNNVHGFSLLSASLLQMWPNGLAYRARAAGKASSGAGVGSSYLFVRCPYLMRPVIYCLNIEPPSNQVEPYHPEQITDADRNCNGVRGRKEGGAQVTSKEQKQRSHDSQVGGSFAKGIALERDD